MSPSRSIAHFWEFCWTGKPEVAQWATDDVPRDSWIAESNFKAHMLLETQKSVA